MDVNGFLPEDYRNAFKETTCIMDRMHVMKNELVEGDYETAIVATEDALRSFKQLHKMQLDKEKHDEFLQTIQDAQDNGMGFVVIKRLLQNG